MELNTSVIRVGVTWQHLNGPSRLKRSLSGHGFRVHVTPPRSGGRAVKYGTFESRRLTDVTFSTKDVL